MFGQITMAIAKMKYDSRVRAVTLDQLTEIADSLEYDNPEVVRVIAALVLKNQGTMWSLRKIKKQDSALLSAAERKIRSLVANSQDSFKSFLRVLRSDVAFSETSLNDLKTELPIALQSLRSQLQQQNTLIELMWEALSPEAKQNFIDLFEK